MIYWYVVNWIHHLTLNVNPCQFSCRASSNFLDTRSGFGWFLHLQTTCPSSPRLKQNLSFLLPGDFCCSEVSFLNDCVAADLDGIISCYVCLASFSCDCSAATSCLSCSISVLSTSADCWWALANFIARWRLVRFACSFLNDRRSVPWSGGLSSFSPNRSFNILSRSPWHCHILG